MALIRIDWNPSPAAIRRFGLMLAGLALPLAAFWAWRGHPRLACWIVGAGVPVGALTAALPSAFGRYVYKSWMGVSFVIGSVVSPLLLGLVYYGMITPFALVMKLAGRDALKLKRPATDSYWTPLSIPEEKSYFERLY